MIAEIAILSAVFLLLVVIVGAALYDVDEIRKLHDYKQHPHKKIYKNRPFISVIVISSGGVDALERCIGSIMQNNYKKREVIVVCNNNLYKVKKLLREYPKVRLSTTKLATIDAVRSAYRHYGKGDIVLTLNDASIVNSDSLDKIVWQYNAENQPDVILLNRRILTKYSSTGLFVTYYLLVLQLYKRMRSALRANYSLPLINSVVSKKTLLSGISQTSYFASDISVIVTASPSYKQLTASTSSFYQGHRFQKRILQLLRMVGWLVAALLIGYFVYVATVLRQPTLLLLTVTGLGLMIVFAIFLDTALTLKKKIIYCLLSPVTYILFYVMSLVNCLRELRTIIPLSRRG